MRLLAFLPALLTMFAACGGPSIESTLTPAQRQAVNDLLSEQPNAAVMQPSDCVSPDLAKFQSENPDYQPYFAEGDFTRDGSFDFVIATKSAGAYDLWLFPGSGAGYGIPINFAKVTWLHEGGFITRNGNLYVGSFYGEDGNYYSWNNAVNRFGIVTAETP